MTQIPFKRAVAGTNGALGEFPQELIKASGPQAPGPRLVFFNGHFIKNLSSQEGLPTGVLLGNLAEFIQTHPALIEPLLKRMDEVKEHSFVHLNTAFLSDGAFVYIPRGTILSAPVELLFVSGHGGGATVAQSGF